MASLCDGATVEKKRAMLVASRTRWTHAHLDLTESHSSPTDAHLDVTESHSRPTDAHLDVTESHSCPTHTHMDATGSHATQYPSDAQGREGCDSVTEWLTTTEDNAKHSLPPSTESHAEPLKRNLSGEDDLVLGIEASLYGEQGVKSAQESHGKQQGVRTVQEFLRSSRSSPAISRWNSFNSAVSGHSTPLSVMEVLNLWNDDPEEVLLDLGFGCEEPDISNRIPARFINFQSKAKGINIHVFLEAQKNRLDLENPDVGNRFRQLEVLQQVTTAFSSLVGGAKPPSSSSSAPGALTHADQSAEARERRARMGALLRRASKKSLGQMQNAQAADPTPDQGASTNPSLTTQTSATSQCPATSIGDKRSPLKRARSSLQENAGLMPLAEEQGTDGPDDSSRDGALPRLEPLKEGLHLPPVPASAVLLRKRSQAQARDSFEMEEILSFDDGSITGSYTGGSETTVRGGVLRTNSCQSDSSGFMEEPFIPCLSQQGALTPTAPQLIKALSSLSGDSMESQVTVRDASSAPPSPSLFPPPSVPTSSSPRDQDTCVPLSSSSPLPISPPVGRCDLESFGPPAEEVAPANPSPRRSPACLPTASAFTFDPPKSPSPMSEGASAPDTVSSCTLDSSSLEKGVLQPDSMFTFDPNPSDLEDVFTPNTVVVEEEEDEAHKTEVEPLAHSPGQHEELPDPTGRFGKVKEEEGGHIEGYGEAQEQSCTSPCSASPSYAGLEEEESQTAPRPKIPSSPSPALGESAAADSCPQADSRRSSPGTDGGGGVSPLLRMEDEPTPPPASLLLATSPDETQEQRLSRRASPSPPCPFREDNLPNEVSAPSDSDERLPDPASLLSSSSPLPHNVPMPSVSTRQTGECRVESDESFFHGEAYHPPELASFSPSHGEDLPPVPSAFELKGGRDNSAFQPQACSPGPRDELPGHAGAESPQSPCHSPLPFVTDSPMERLPGPTEHMAVDACVPSDTPFHGDDGITDMAPTHPPPVSDIIRGETDHVFAAGPEDVLLPQRAEEGVVYSPETGGSAALQTETALQEMVRDESAIEPGQMVVERFGKVVEEEGARDAEATESGVDSQTRSPRPHDERDKRFGEAVEACETDGEVLLLCSRTVPCLDSQARPPGPHDERPGQTGEGEFGKVTEDNEGGRETEEVEPHVIDFVPCDEIPELNHSRITEPGPIEVESLDMVFETSVDGSDGDGDYGDVDAICRELDSDGYVYWAEPIQVASPSPILGEEFEATPPSRSLITDKADRESPSTSTVMRESSSAPPRTPPPSAPSGRGAVRATRSVSVQMPSMLSSHSVSHIVHRKDVPYTPDSKPATAPAAAALPAGTLPLDTSTPLSAVQSWTDLQMQRNMLSRQTETLPGPQTSQSGGSTARPLITTCGAMSAGRHRHRGHFSSTPSLPSAPPGGWPPVGHPSASTRTVRTKSVSLDTGLWPDDEDEELDGVEDSDRRWEDALMSGAACCSTCDRRCACCAQCSTAQMASHGFPQYTVDELEGMMRCIRQFRSVLTDIEERVCEDQTSVYSALSDTDREELHDITELRRAVKAEAGQLETQLNELACQYDDSIKMKIHRLLDEQSLLCSQLSMLPSSSSPPTLHMPSSTSSRLLQPPPPSLHAPNSTSNHRSVATQCSMAPPWLSVSEASQSAPLSPQDTWSRSSPPGSEDICHGLVCSPTKTDRLDFVGFLQRLKESLRHSVNTDSLE